jgi:hypothetical protein
MSHRRVRRPVLPRNVLVPLAASIAAAQSSSACAENAHPLRRHQDRIEEVRPNRPLLLVSASVLGVAYATSVLVAATSGSEDDHGLYVPILGPWIALATSNCSGPQSVRCQTGNSGRGVGLFLDGLAQTAGAVGLALSFVIPQTKSVRYAPTAMVVRPGSVGSGAGVIVTLRP